MARPKKYIIKLSDEERATLRKTIRNKNLQDGFEALPDPAWVGRSTGNRAHSCPACT